MTTEVLQDSLMLYLLQGMSFNNIIDVRHFFREGVPMLENVLLPKFAIYFDFRKEAEKWFRSQKKKIKRQQHDEQDSDGESTPSTTSFT